MPAGVHTAAVAKTYIATGMKDQGVRLIGPGNLTQDTKLRGMSEEMAGLITMHHYSADYDTPVNRAFVAAWKEAYGEDTTPDFMGVGGQDGMAAIAHAIKEQDGNITVEGTMKALAGWTYESPRGPFMIDPRDAASRARPARARGRAGRRAPDDQGARLDPAGARPVQGAHDREVQVAGTHGKRNRSLAG